jgi:hypothetical protein
MAASSALFIVCRSCCDLMSMCVVMILFKLVTPALSVGFPFTCEPSVYTKSLGFHFLLTCGDWFVGLLLLCVGVLV